MSWSIFAKRIACLALSLAGFTPVYADIVSVIGPPSSLGAAPAKIAPPSDALNQCATFPGQVGFDEAQGVVTPVPFSADDAVVIPAGSLVDSHMIFLNIGVPGGATHTSVVWTFRRPIIAVMSDSGGVNEAASTPTLGAATTNYTGPPTVACVPFGPVGAAPYAARGLETTLAAFPFTHTACGADDCYTVVGGTSLLVSMGVTQPGDHIRVVTLGRLRVDAKPGSNPNCVNPESNGVISVAVLGTTSFSVYSIVPGSVTFGGAPPLRWSYEDVNLDGVTDLVLKYDLSAVLLPPLDPAGCAVVPLKGTLTNGTAISGGDILCVAGLPACENSTPQPEVP